MSFSPSPTLAACSAHVICKPQGKTMPCSVPAVSQSEPYTTSGIKQTFPPSSGFPPAPSRAGLQSPAEQQAGDGGGMVSSERSAHSPPLPKASRGCLVVVGMEHRDALALGKAGGKLGWAGVHWNLPQNQPRKQERVSVKP